MKQHARLGAVAVVQLVDGQQVDEILRQEAPVARRVQVVGGLVVLGLAARRAEEARLAVEAAAGQELQRQVGVRGAAHAQVDLERGRREGAVGGIPVREEVDAEAAHDAVRREHLADALAGLLDRHAVAVVGRKAAAEEHLAARPAQDLVVGRDREHVAVRADPQLRARRVLLAGLDELLDDPAHLRHLVEVGLGGLGRDRELHLAQRLADRGLRVARRVAKERVTLAREALVELHDGALQAGAARAQLAERLGDLVRRVQVLEALGQRHAGFAEHLAAARLGAEARKLRVAAVQRDPEQHSELSLVRGRVEDRQVGALGVHDAGADALDEPRPLQDLLGERARRGVVGAQQREPRARVARRDPGQELQVVLEDDRVDRLRGHVHHARARVAQPDQQEQQPLLVEARARDLAQLALVERERGHHHRRVRLLLAQHQRVPHLGEPRLEPLELGDLVLRGEILEERRLRDHAPGLRAPRPCARRPRARPARTGSRGPREAGARPRAPRRAAAARGTGGSAAGRGR